MVDNYRNRSYYSIFIIVNLVINSRNEFLKHLGVIILVANNTGTSVSFIAIIRASLFDVLMSPAINRVFTFRNYFSIIKICFTIGSLLLIVHISTITTTRQ